MKRMIARNWLSAGGCLGLFLFWVSNFAFAQGLDSSLLNTKALLKSNLVSVKNGPQVLIVNSTSNRIFYQGENRITMPLQLPKHTIRWYYSVLIAPRDEQHAKYQGLLSALMPLLSKDPIALATGAALKWITPLPRKEALNFYLIEGKAERDKFEKGEVFKVWQRHYNVQSLSGSEERVPEGVFYLGFENENFLQGVSVQVEVVALTGWRPSDRLLLRNFIARELGSLVLINGKRVWQRKSAYAHFFTDDDIADSIMGAYAPEEWFEKTDAFKRLAIAEFGAEEEQ